METPNHTESIPPNTTVDPIHTDQKIVYMCTNYAMEDIESLGLLEDFKIWKQNQKIIKDVKNDNSTKSIEEVNCECDKK
jgi:hypothetical protein